MRKNLVGPVRYHLTMPDPPPDLPPWFWDRASRILARPGEVHTDACSWMGSDARHPCTCHVPTLLRTVADRVDLAVLARADNPPLEFEQSFDYDHGVQPDQPEHAPRIDQYATSPDPKTVARRIEAQWAPVRFHATDGWNVGIVHTWLKLTDGRWAVGIRRGPVPGGVYKTAHTIWAIYDPRAIVPIENEPQPPAGR